ncbi:hypothetical protein [Aliarcobacter butzleri]|uniref:hypothetical protein n=1 Tax=Aliarcobacter butzleri TaxID=28197 RepID=UPI0021B668F6|nr:hypothetical protein [Aliarcobacter butzleri]MCT7636401.1 hypothetical protein [Aliarcobacter butzleri]
MSFEIGTKVKLKDEFRLADSPYEMIIESIEDSEISVFWFGNDSSKKEGKFNESFLEEISDEEYDPTAGAFFDDSIEDHCGSSTF